VTHRRWLAALAWIAIVVAVVALRPRQTPGPFLRDFEAYWSAGATANLAGDPYGTAIWQAERAVPGVDALRNETLPFVGPPQTLLGWRLIARVPYAAGAMLWSSILVCALLALAAATVIGSGAPRAPSAFVAATALAIAFGPITSDIALGQVALPAYLCATLVPLLAGRSLLATVAAAAFAFGQPNVSLGLVSQLGRGRAALALLLAALVAYALGALAAGWAWPAEYARIAIAHGAAERFSAIQLSPAAVARGFGAPPSAAAVWGFLFAGLAAAAAVAIALVRRDYFARFAAFSALAPFVAGFFHEHDLLVAYAAAVWSALRTRATARAFALAGTLLVAVDWLGLAQRPSGIAQSALLAVAAFAAFAALGDAGEARRSALVAAPVAALFIATAFIASHHPAPVWPDALGPFRAARAMPIAALWSAEQRASGLFAIVPAWAFLRSLSLLGCASLAYAIYLRPSCCRTGLSRSDGSS
jgi:hypothetical protein